MIYIDVEDVLYIHDEIIAASGGLPGVKSQHQLESVVARPRQSAFGEEMFSTLFEKAAAMLDAIANNHVFNDGSKRTAMAVAVFFLEQNQINVHFSNEDFEIFILSVVEAKPDISEIAGWLESHSS